MKTLYYNGNVYTGNDFTEAFIVKDGYFVKTGKNEELLKEGFDEKVDLNNKFVCAGFDDSHMHLIGLGNTLNVAKLNEHSDSLKGMIEYLKEFSKDRVPGSWIKGRGWNQDYFTDVKRMPSKYDLDEVAKDDPIILTRACGHCVVLNSKALELVHIDENTPSPLGGAIDFENGLLYDNAIDMIDQYIPVPSKDEIKEMIRSSSRFLNSFGITSCQSDDYSTFRQIPFELINEAYDELKKSGELTVRVFEQSNFTTLDELKRFVEAGNVTGVGDDKFKIGPLKMLGDGSLGSRSASLSKPYADDPSQIGFCLFTDEQMNSMIDYANAHNMSVAVHAIGDKCLDQVLTAIELALKNNPREDHRHGIVHCQISRPDQLDKIAELKLHVYAQSVFLDYDNHIVEARVGKELASTSYSWKTLMKNGVTVSNGSDAPVEIPDVMKGIECAVTRTSLDGTGPYLPDEAFTIKEAIDSFTKCSAIGSFEEDYKGMIKENYLADFVILDEDPFETEPKRLHEIKIKATYLGGHCVYQN